jgi:hypothetical protein
MPADLEKRLRHGARSLGLKVGSKRWRAYVYGTMARLGQLRHAKRRRRRSTRR